MASLVKAVFKRYWNTRYYSKSFLNLTSGLVLVSFSVSLAKSGVHVFVLTRFPSSRFKTFLLLFVFAFLISNDSLIFLLWYCCSADKVLGFIQLNCPWYSRKCSVAPELSHFPLKLSCWCSVVLVITFLLVSPIASTV